MSNVEAPWRHAVDTAGIPGYGEFLIGWDPNAPPFCAAMGAEWFEEKPTGHPAWMVHIFRYSIPLER